MKKAMTRKLSLILILGIFAAMLAGCSSSGGQTSQNPSGTSQPSQGAQSGEEKRDYLNLALGANLAILDPQYSTTASEWDLNIDIYDTLVDGVDGDITVFKPCLAESWEISEDGTEYTFHLKEGVKFHNGDPLTADDVVYSINRNMTSPVTSSTTYMMKEVVKVDEKTVKVILNYPYKPFMSMMANFNMGIVNKKLVEQYGNGTPEMVCGTGAYKLESWKTGESIVLKANEDYHGTVPYFKTVTYKIMTNTAAATMAFENGEIDMLSGMGTEDIETALENPENKLVEVRRNTWRYLAMNQNMDVFKDVRVRQAICHALDRDSINLIAYDGEMYTDNDLLLGKNSEGYTENIPKYEYNVEKAKELLAEAGVSNLTLKLTFIAEYQASLATAVQSCLNAVGINVEMNGLETAAWSEALVGGDYELGLMEMSTLPYNTDRAFFAVFHSEGYYNIGNYFSDEVDEMIIKARTETDEATRVGIYERLAYKVREDAPYAPIVMLKAQVLMNSHIQNVHFEPVNLLVKVQEMTWE